MIGRGHRGRTDANHKAVVAALRKLGCIVRSTASVGVGFPDLIVGWKRITVLMEVKDGTKPPSGRVLTDDESVFFASWHGGPLVIVQSPEEAVNTMLALTA